MSCRIPSPGWWVGHDHREVLPAPRLGPLLRQGCWSRAAHGLSGTNVACPGNPPHKFGMRWAPERKSAVFQICLSRFINILSCLLLLQLGPKHWVTHSLWVLLLLIVQAVQFQTQTWKGLPSFSCDSWQKSGRKRNDACLEASPSWSAPRAGFNHRNSTAGPSGERKFYEKPWLDSGSPSLWTHQDFPEHGLKTTVSFSWSQLLIQRVWTRVRVCEIQVWCNLDILVPQNGTELFFLLSPQSYWKWYEIYSPEKKQGFLKCNFFGSLFVRYSFTAFQVAKAFYYETFCEKNEQKKVYYFFKIYCKNPHFQLFIAALAGILACSFVIYSEHST